jgi:large subunit ribosomal protein L29
MKPSELRDLSIEELEAEIHRLKEELFSMRFKHKVQTLPNPLRLRIIRREIARALTILNEKKIRR